jgi:hypothetical protein
MFSVPDTLEEAIQMATLVAQRTEECSKRKTAELELEEEDEDRARGTYIKERMMPQILGAALQLNPWINGAGDEAWVATAAEVNRQLGTQQRPIAPRKIRERVSEVISDYRKRQSSGNRSGHEPTSSKMTT